MSAEKHIALARARARADLARLRFGTAFDGLLDRFEPDHLKAEAMDFATEQFNEAKKGLLSRLRHWPFVLGAFGSVLLLVLIWKPALGVAEKAARILGILLPLMQLWRPSNDQSAPSG